MEADVQEKSATEASNGCVMALLVYRNHWQTLGSLGWNIAGRSGRVSPWAEDATRLWWQVQSAHSLPSLLSYPLFTSFTLCLLIKSQQGWVIVPGGFQRSPHTLFHGMGSSFASPGSSSALPVSPSLSSTRICIATAWQDFQVGEGVKQLSRRRKRRTVSLEMSARCFLPRVNIHHVLSRATLTIREHNKKSCPKRQRACLHAPNIRSWFHTLGSAISPEFNSLKTWNLDKFPIFRFMASRASHQGNTCVPSPSWTLHSSFGKWSVCWTVFNHFKKTSKC